MGKVMAPSGDIPAHKRAHACGADFKPLIAIVAGGVAAAIWPRPWDSFLLRMRGALLRVLGSGKVTRRALVVQKILQVPFEQAAQISLQNQIMSMETAWHRIRSMLPSGPLAELRIQGFEHLEQGLAAGKGAILWGTFFCGYTIPKAALKQAGIRLFHLSREDHAAPSRTWLGMRVARLFWRAEERYVEKRVILPLDGSLGYMKELIKLLEANQVVSISGELKAVRQNQAAPFFHWQEEFATGAPGLAFKVGSALLPMFVKREGPLRYCVVIEPPITAERGAKRDEFVRDAVAEFAGRIENNVRQHPADWDRWNDADIRVRA
jgi:lauroyl/myristoyl acyltransferase